jgi:hypothetical protein
MTTAVDDSDSTAPRIAALAEQVRRAADQHGAHHHLDGAGAEHPGPHRPQARRGEFEADHEHQEQHADLGEHLHALAAGEGEPGQLGKTRGDQAQAERAEQGTGSKEAEHLVDAQPLQRGNEDAGEDQEQDDFPEKREGVLLLHWGMPLGLWAALAFYNGAVRRTLAGNP